MSNQIWSSCTATLETGNFCNASIPDGAPVSMCAQHLLAAFRFCEDLLGRVEDSERFARFAANERRQSSLHGQTVVYYARFGDYIKIGTTSDIQTRMRLLRPDDLLAVEPGYRDLETQRHRQFAHLKVADGRQDYFHTEPDLVEFIASFPPYRPGATTSATPKPVRWRSKREFLNMLEGR